MKKLYWSGILGLVLCASSCSTTSTFNSADVTPRFHEESSVNAVLQFSSWDYTFLIRPQYTVGGYLQQVHPADIGKALDHLNVTRGTAVVVVGWTYNGDQLDHLLADWKTILGGCGFHRVVFLRAQLGDKLNGSIIIDDTSAHFGSIQGLSRGG
jgi:hypothetical protein